jgi:hypothetical protein
MSDEAISKNNEWQCLLMDISGIQSRIANFKRKGNSLLSFPYPDSKLKKLCLLTDYLKSKGFL